MSELHDLSSAQRLQLLSRAVTDQAMIMLDRDGSIVEWSAGAEHLLGWAGNEALGQSVGRLLHGEDAASADTQADLVTALANGQVGGECRHLCKDGAVLQTYQTIYVIRNEDGVHLGFGMILRATQGLTETGLPGGRQAGAERAFLAAVLDNIEDGIVACNSEGELTLFNRATRDFHGLPEASLPPEQWADYYDLYHPDGMTPLRTEEVPLYRALEGDHFRNSEMVIAPKGGKRRIFRASGRPLVDDQGRHLGAMVSMHDITSLHEARLASERVVQEQARREQAEADAVQLRLMEERFRSLVMATAQVVWTANAQGDGVEPSATWYAFTSQHHERWKGRGWLEVVHPEDRDRASQAWEHSVATGKLFQTKYRLRHKDGGYRWTAVRGVPIRSPDGSIREWVGVNMDVTEVQEAETNLRQSEQEALAAAHRADTERRQLDAVLEAVPVGILVTDLTGTVIEMNSAIRRLLGGRQPPTPESFDYRAWTGIWADGSERHGQPLRPHEWPLARALRGEQAHDSAIEVESLDVPPLRRIVLVSAAPIRAGDGAITGAVCAVMDVSDQVRADLSLRETAARLQFTLDAAQIGDWDLDLVNDKAHRSLRHDQCFGYSQPAPDWGYATFLEHVHPEDRAAVERDFNAAFRQMKDWHFECRVVWPDGSIHWIAAHGSVYGDQGAPTRMTGIVFDITDRKHTEHKVRHASLHDPLTGLPNRAMLFEYASHVLPHIKRTHQCAAVFFLDMDRFKRVNDSHGHEIGDALLKDVARRLTRTLRAEDVIVRLGGDEFLILLQNIKNAGRAAEVARNLVDRINEPYLIDELTLALSVSIGISIYPGDGNDIDTLINHADLAMYEAKQAGRNNYQFYSPDLAAAVRLSMVIEQQLKTALSTEGFHLFYQPVLNIQTGEIVSVEALLRWQDKDVGPDQFVPIAEATGIINPIGRWLLEEAAQQYKAWIDNGLDAIPIAVNVSVVEFRDRNFFSNFRRTIQKYGLGTDALQLELTETAVMDDIEHAVGLLTRLKEIGVTILLDDFGTGHSSLAYLARLPLDKVKIDRSFTAALLSDAGSRTVTDAMIALARTLSLEVVVEGIESEAVLDFVRAHGCNQGQGFFLAEPMSGADFEAWYWEYHGRRSDLG